MNNDEVVDAVLDVILQNGGTWTGPWSRTLYSLSEATHGPDGGTQGTMYQATSRAVIRLEELGLIRVTRAYREEAHKANIIIRIEVV